MRVLALDPGERVGWARADLCHDGAWLNLRHGITPLRDMAIAVHHALFAKDGEDVFSDYDVVVVEDWRLYPREAKTMIGSAFPAVQFIGMVRLCCWLSGAELVMQGADVKRTADKSLASLWPEMHAKVTQSISHDDGHDLDALRHLWFYTWKNYPVEQGAAA